MFYEYFLAVCCLFWWCIAFICLAGGAIVAVTLDPTAGGICWCISFMTWAMGLAIKDKLDSITRDRIHNEIIARYRNNG